MADDRHCYRCGDQLDGLPDEPIHNGMHFCSVMCMESYFDAVDAAIAARDEERCQNNAARTVAQSTRVYRVLRRVLRRRFAAWR